MGNAALVPANKEKEMAAKTGLPVEQISNGVVLFGGKPYLNAAGRRYKMDERFGPGEWSVQVDTIMGEEYDHIMKSWGRKPPCILAKARIIFNGKVIAEDYGWAAPDTTPAGKKQFDENGLGLAATKAQNRAMGQMIANGFASEEKAGERQRMTIETGSVEAGFLKETARLKKQLGEEEYYRILQSHGAEHADDAVLQGQAIKMGEIISDMASGTTRKISEDVYGEASVADTHPDPDPPVTHEERLQSRLDLLARIQDDDLPTEARGDAVMDLLVDLCDDQKIKEECPMNQDKSYAEIASGYVSEAMVNSDFDKCYDVLKRTMDVAVEG
tara:strand:+ start:17145 stop:18131 length:987 start_codon:yes stop_codon:yes gene_type:complete